MSAKHIVIDARIRQATTGRPVDRLLDELQKLDKKNRYTVLLKPGDDWQPRVKNFTAKTCRYKIFSLNPVQQFAFSEWLYRLKPDLVHFTLTGQQPLFYFGKQITFTHDLTMLKHTRAGRLPKWLHWLRMQGYGLLMFSAHRRAKITHVPTEYVADAVNKKYLHTNRRTVVTYEAADAPAKTKVKKPDVERLGDNFIMYVGAAFPHKNLQRLCHAFEQLRHVHPDLQLVLVGKPEYHAKKLRRWVKQRPYASSVLFTGFVPDEELSWLYENARAYVFPSLSEGFGLPGLEAMVHGCPLVSSDATCLPEVYGDAAAYFDPLDVDSMVAAINRVITNDKKRKSLVVKGEKQAAKYSWHKMAEQTLEIYNQTLAP